MFFQFALVSDKPEVFLLKYLQTAILQVAHFRRVVKPISIINNKPQQAIEYFRMNNDESDRIFTSDACGILVGNFKK